MNSYAATSIVKERIKSREEKSTISTTIMSIIIIVEEYWISAIIVALILFTIMSIEVKI